MRKWIAAFAAVAAFAGLAACGSDDRDERKPSTVTVTSHETVTEPSVPESGQSVEVSEPATEEAAPVVEEPEPEIYSPCSQPGVIYGDLICDGANGNIWLQKNPDPNSTVSQHPDRTGEPCLPGVDTTKVVDGQEYGCSGEHGVWVPRY